jgi:hypothetical protein
MHREEIKAPSAVLVVYRMYGGHPYIVVGCDGKSGKFHLEFNPPKQPQFSTSPHIEAPAYQLETLAVAVTCRDADVVDKSALAQESQSEPLKGTGYSLLQYKVGQVLSI